MCLPVCYHKVLHSSISSDSIYMTHYVVSRHVTVAVASIIITISLLRIIVMIILKIIDLLIYAHFFHILFFNDTGISKSYIIVERYCSNNKCVKVQKT